MFKSILFIFILLIAGCHHEIPKTGILIRKIEQQPYTVYCWKRAYGKLYVSESYKPQLFYFFLQKDGFQWIESVNKNDFNKYEIYDVVERQLLW